MRVSNYFFGTPIETKHEFEANSTHIFNPHFLRLTLDMPGAGGRGKNWENLKWMHSLDLCIQLGTATVRDSTKKE